MIFIRSCFSPYQREGDNYSLPSVDQELNIQKRKKYALLPFDDKRCYESNIGNTLWQ